MILGIVGKGFTGLSHSFIEGIFVKFSLVKTSKWLFNAFALFTVSEIVLPSTTRMEILWWSLRFALICFQNCL